MTSATGSPPLDGLREITEDLSKALGRFRVETRLDDLARKGVPDARHRLEHVLRMTDSAAHRTLDLVEQALPLADRIAQRAAALADVRRLDGRASEPQLDACLAETSTDAARLREQLSDVLLAQGFQDLTGQIIRGVLGLVADVETTLQRLVALSPVDAVAHRSFGPTQTLASSPAPGMAFGPVVPQLEAGPVVDRQSDADALLHEYGQ